MLTEVNYLFRWDTLTRFYLHSDGIPRVIYKTSFLAAVKDINLKKSRKLPLQTLLFFAFKIRIPLGAMCCENFGRFLRRKFKKITNKARKTAKNTLIWAFLI